MKRIEMEENRICSVCHKDILKGIVGIKSSLTLPPEDVMFYFHNDCWNDRWEKQKTNWKDKITRISELNYPDGTLILMLLEITEHKFVVCNIGTEGGYEFSDEEIQAFPNKEDAVKYMDKEIKECVDSWGKL